MRLRLFSFSFSSLASCGVGLSLMLAPGVVAQESGAAGSSGSRSWFDIIYTDGGFLMYPLTLCSMAVVGLAIFIGMRLGRRKFFSDDLHERLKDHMAAVRVRSAIDAAASSPTYLGRLAAAGLSGVDGSDRETLGQERVEEAMAEFAVMENRHYMQWLGYFSLLAQISPMIGLLGTVQGMIGAFANLEQNRQNPGILAGYISVALYTTAAGLIIAIPSVLLYYILKNKLNARVTECIEAVRGLLDSAQEAVNPNRKERLIPDGL